MADNVFRKSPLELVLENQQTTSLPPQPEVPARERIQPVAPARAAAAREAQLMPAFTAAAEKYQVPLNIVMALAEQESNYNPRAIGLPTKWGRAKGLMQNLDSTARGLGIDPFDPVQSINAAAMQLRERLDKGYSMEDAVKEHFAGPNRKMWGEKTDTYGREVLARAVKIADRLGVQAPAADYSQQAPSPLTQQAQNDWAQERGLPEPFDLQPAAPQIPQAQAEQPQSLELPVTTEAKLVKADGSPMTPGELPKDGFLSATGKQLGNVPERFQNALGGILQKIGEGIDDTSLYAEASKAGIIKALQDSGEIVMKDGGGLAGTQLPYFKDGTFAGVSEVAQYLRQNADKYQAMTGMTPNAVTETGRDLSKSARESMTPVNPDGTAAKYGSMIIGSTAEMLPAILASIVTRNPTTGMSMIGGQVYGQSYDTARNPSQGKKQLNPSDASSYAMFQSLAEAIPEALPIGVIIKPSANFFKGILKAGAAEAAQEGLTGAIQAAIDKGSIDPNMTWGEARQQIIDSVIVGAGAGASLKAGVDAGRALPEALRSKEEKIGRALDATVQGTQLPSTEAEAARAFDPSNAQVVQAQPAAPTGPLGRALASAPGLVVPPAAQPAPQQAAPAAEVAPAPEQAPAPAAEAAPAPAAEAPASIPFDDLLFENVVVDVGGDPMPGQVVGVDAQGVMLKGQDGNQYLIPVQDIEQGVAKITPVQQQAEAAPAQEPRKPEASQVQQQSELPRVTIPGQSWLNENAQVDRDVSDRLGITAEIENLFANGLTANQVRNQLQKEGKLERIPYADQQGFVVNVRATLGIPSQMGVEGAAEFQRWKQQRENRVTPKQPAPEDMTPAQLHERMAYLKDQAKVHGWDGRLTQERQRVEEALATLRERELAQRDEETDAVDQVPVNVPRTLAAKEFKKPEAITDEAGQASEAAPQERQPVPAGVPAAEVVPEAREAGQQRIPDSTKVAEQRDSKTVPAGQPAAEQPAALSQPVPEVLGADGKPKWFGSKPKAVEFLGKKGLTDTHEVKKVGAKWEIHPKEPVATVTNEGTTQQERGVNMAGSKQPVKTGDAMADYWANSASESVRNTPPRVVNLDQTAAPAPSAAQSVAETQTPDADGGQGDAQQRAANAYRAVLESGRANPDRIGVDMPKLWLEQMQEQADNPNRYHRVFEVENPAGYKVGQNIGTEENPRYVVSIQKNGDRIQFKSVGLDGFGGWRDVPGTKAGPDLTPPSKQKTPEQPQAKSRNQISKEKAQRAIDRSVEAIGAKKGEKVQITGRVGYAADNTYTIEDIDSKGNVYLKSDNGKTSISPAEIQGAKLQGTTFAKVEDKAAEASQQAVQKPAPKASANKVFTEDAAEKARALLRSKLGQLNSGVDPEVLQAGITLAGYHIEKGARTFAAYSKAMLEDLGDVVRPYLKSWYMGVKYDPRAAGFDGMSTAAEVESFNVDEAKLDEPSTPDAVEQDGAIPENAVGETAGATQGSGSLRESERAVDDAVAAGRTRPVDGSGVPATSPLDAGTPGDQRVPAEDGQPGSEAGVAGTSDPRGNRRGGGAGVQSERQADTRLRQKAQKRSAELTGRQKQQADADQVPVQLLDLDNIKATLPLLSGQQQNDVLKAEQRLFRDGGKGKLLTNGTGTGKTYSGLGVAKRVVRRGGDVLIVSPAGVIPAWEAGAKDLGMTAYRLKSKQDGGKSGVSVTSYQNFRDNQELMQRNFDLVIYDESHHLMGNMDGESTSASVAHKAMTGHPDYERARGSMAIQSEFDAYRADTKKEIDKLVEGGMSIVAAESKIYNSPKFKKRYEELTKRAAALSDKLAAEQKEKNTKVLFLSASPFAGHKSVFYTDGYLFDSKVGAKDSQAYNTGSPEAQYLVSNFGYRMRYNRVTQPGPEVDVGLLERDWADRMFQSGAMTGRKIELDHDYSREFVAVAPGIGEQIDKAFQAISWSDYPKLAQQLINWRKGGSDRQLTEALRAKATLDRIEQHLKMGRKVVVFHERQQLNIANPFHFKTPDAQTEAELAKLKTAHPWIFDIDLGGLLAAPVAIGNRFGDRVAYFSGLNKSTRDKELAEFNRDGGTKDILVIQKDAGKEGLSAHDITGKHQRALMVLNTPVSPSDAIQMEGRTYRHGLRSDAIIEYPTIQTSFEKTAYRETVSTRTSTAENLAMGSQARNLREAFREGYLDPATEAPNAKQGRGGRQADSASDGLSMFDRAKTYYFRRQKKTSKNKAAEGADYFATPEPLGQKMVEWAKLEVGEKALEPSGGHGAIARWFPESTTNLALEPSPELVGELGIVTSGEVRQMRFEDLNVVNKFHAVVMNPPFGQGGATAIEHIGKAVDHLKDGGRVIAIYPKGPAADAKFDKWFEEKRGVYLVASIDLPAITFNRAGTSVATRILVLDKDTRGNNVSQGMVQRDLTSVTDINELFERIEDMDLPARPDVTVTGRDVNLAEELVKNADGQDVWRATMTEFTNHGPAAAIGLREVKKLAEKFSGEVVSDNNRFWKTTHFDFATEQDRERFFAGVLDASEAKKDTSERYSIDDTIEVDGKQRPATNSNGQRIHPNEEGIRNFWRWFGESKVVDDRGRPLVVYHGTGREFHAFDKGMAGSFTGAESAAGGFFFTDSQALANQFKNEAQRKSFNSKPVRNALERLPDEEFESLADDVGLDGDLEVSGRDEVTDEILFRLEEDNRTDYVDDRHNIDRDLKRYIGSEPFAQGNSGRVMSVYVAMQDPRVAEMDDEQSFVDRLITDELRAAKRNGKDGVIIRGMLDSAAMDDKGNSQISSDVFIAFEPEQIKSATGNTGDFSRDNSDIRYSIGEKVGTAEQLTRDPLIKALVDAGKVVIHKDSSTLPSSRKEGVIGFTAKDGTIHVVEGRTAQSVLLHEAFHSGGQSLLGNKQWRNLMERLGAMYKANKDSTGFWRNAVERVRNSGLPDGSRLAIEEFGAYAIENYDRAPAGVKKWVESVIGAVKAWLLQRFDYQAGNITAGQLRALARAALRSMNQPQVSEQLGELYSRGNTDGHFNRSLTSRTLTNAMPALLQTAPLDRMIEEMGKATPALKKYLHEKRLMDAYRNQLHQKHDELAQEWLRFNLKHKEAGKALSRVMHRSTIEQIDPTVDLQEQLEMRFNSGNPSWDAEDMNADAKAAEEAKAQETYDSLKAEFDALPPQAQRLYKVVRDSYKTQVKELDKILMDNLEKALDIAAQRAERKYNDEVEEIYASGLAGSERDAALAKAEKKLRNAQTKHRYNKSARMLLLRQQFERNRLAGPYFPLSRFGNYFVTAKDAEGKVVEFSRFESEGPQLEFAKQMRDQGLNVEVGFLSQTDRLKSKVDPAFVADVEEILNESEASDAVKDQIWQRYLESMPELSLRKKFIHRKGRAGFNEDALRAFASHMFHSDHQMARLKHAGQMQEHIEKAKQEARTATDPTRAAMVVNEVEQKNEFVMNPTGAQWAQNVAALGFTYYLATNPSSWIANLTQTPIIGAPILAAGIGGRNAMAQAAYQLGKAAKDFAMGKGSIGDANVTSEEKQALNYAYDLGVADKSQAHDLAGVGENGAAYSPLRADIMKKIGWGFHQVERFNREVTYIAAYRMARAKGMGHQEAMEKAADLTWKAHFNYDNSNRPRVMQGDVAKVLLMFRNYQVNMLWRLFRDVHQSINAKSPQERKEALYQLGGVTGMMMMTAGLRGVWLYGIAMVIANALFGDDADEQMKKGLVDAMGKDAAGIIMNGLPGHLTATELSGRIGMPDLWFRSPQEPLEGDELYFYMMEQLAGPLGGMAKNIITGASKMADGDVQRGLESMLPKGLIANSLKAYRYGTEGATTTKGDPIVENLGAADVVKQAIGFTPAAIAEQYRANTAMKNKEAELTDARRQLLNDYAKAQKEKDAEAKAEALAAIKAWNKENKDWAIFPKDLIQSLHARRQASQRNEGGIQINKKIERRIRGEAAPAIYQDEE